MSNQDHAGDRAEECGPVHHWLDPRSMKCRCGKLTTVPFFAQKPALAPSLAPPEPAQSLRLAIIHLRSAIENTERGRVYGVLHDAAVGVVNACPTIAGCLAAPPEPEAAPPQNEALKTLMYEKLAKLQAWRDDHREHERFRSACDIAVEDLKEIIIAASSSRSDTPRTKTE